jgi:hypothetical protein
MSATTQIDIFDINGKQVDQCEYWQLVKLLPIFTVLFGAVTWRPRSTVTQPAVDFWEWLETI